MTLLETIGILIIAAIVGLVAIGVSIAILFGLGSLSDWLGELAKRYRILRFFGDCLGFLATLVVICLGLLFAVLVGLWVLLQVGLLPL